MPNYLKKGVKWAGLIKVTVTQVNFKPGNHRVRSGLTQVAGSK
ncbi:hypothetical protein H1P_1180007 [Hyella patelloides LEGE 07179]|uniref:Uncharacterized protein n=1 Tax=Hyella patelloides LEGE 07179 TaxID=945734 RepID=A0A563VJU2_9CYAN|nr:hypothetical protein H1P_1180007 [Hyella patelloides LEGE 07179]